MPCCELARRYVDHPPVCEFLVVKLMHARSSSVCVFSASYVLYAMLLFNMFLASKLACEPAAHAGSSTLCTSLASFAICALATLLLATYSGYATVVPG